MTDCILALCFNTAWSPPEPWAEELASSNPNVRFRMSFMDEGWGFAGYIDYSEGEIQDERSFTCSRNDPDFVEFYEDLVGELPESYDEDE